MNVLRGRSRFVRLAWKGLLQSEVSRLCLKPLDLHRPLAAAVAAVAVAMATIPTLTLAAIPARSLRVVEIATPMRILQQVGRGA